MSAWENLSNESQKVLDLLAFSTALSAAETAAGELDGAPFDDEDLGVLVGLPAELRLPILARLVEVTEAIREGLRLLDGAVLVASGGQAITTA